MLPPVSDPILIRFWEDATEAAEPPLLPPGTVSKSQGLRHAPKKDVSFEEPIANSSQFDLLIIIAPESISFFTTKASYGGI